MEDSETIKEIVNQAVVQAATVPMMAFRDIETGPWPATMPNNMRNRGKKMKDWYWNSKDSTGMYQIGMWNCNISNLK